MAATRLCTVGEGDDRIDFWKTPFDTLFEELWSTVEQARRSALDLPWEEILPPMITPPEARGELIETLRAAEIEYEQDKVFEVLSPGAHIQSEEWDSGGPMSGVYKKARIPLSERKQAVRMLESIVDAVEQFWSKRQGIVP